MVIRPVFCTKGRNPGGRDRFCPIEGYRTTILSILRGMDARIS